MATVQISGTAQLAISPSGEVVGAASGTAQLTISPSGSAHRTREVSGTAQLTISPSGVALRTWPHTLGMPSASTRSILFSAGVPAVVVTDGTELARSDDGEVRVPQSETIREIITVVDEASDLLPTPLDMVELEWADQEGVTWTVQRRPAGGTWQDIAYPAASSYTDGPLEDGDYEYRVMGEDPEGDTAYSDTEAVTIFSAPEPPEDLSASVDSGTLELSWNASPSADVDHYAVYRALYDPVDPSNGPHATPTSGPWSEDVSAISGRLLYLVRAVDSDGHEEANVGQMVAVNLEGGSEVLRPNSPDLLDGRPAAGGEVEVEAGYSRQDEEGEATKLNLYVNDGAGGDIDWSTAVATESLPGGPTSQVTLTSSGLTAGDTYRCGVRAETAAGVEDQNTDYIEVTADDDAPASPDLSAEVV